MTAGGSPLQFYLFDNKYCPHPLFSATHHNKISTWFKMSGFNRNQVFRKNVDVKFIELEQIYQQRADSNFVLLLSEVQNSR